MRHSFFLCAFIVACISASAAEWAGVYRWSETPADQAAVTAAVANGCAQVNFAIRLIARKRLTESTRPHKQLTFKLAEGQISCLRDNDNPIVTPADGSAIEWKRIDGKTFKVAQKMDDAGLKQIFIDDDGSTRTNIYTLDATGAVLQMQAELSSKSLKQPIGFTLTYRRQ